MTEPMPKPCWRTSPLHVALIGLLLVIAVVALFVIIIGWDLRRSLTALRGRHIEATEAIQRVYAFYGRQGRWPTKSEIEASGNPSIPETWDYSSDPQGTYAVLSLHGQYHSSLHYWFSPPRQGAVCNTWTLSVEGDKSEFEADVDYVAGGKP
jgi:hypothetical protein